MQPARVYITNAQIAEGDGGTKTMRFRVSLSEASQDSVVVNFQNQGHRRDCSC